MKSCPRCCRPYEDDARFCPDDGTPLLDIADPYIGQSLLGQFEVIAVCGRGSMGTVYRARQTNMGREVAIKVLRRDLLQDATVVKRFRREARASARLSHPNIITVYLVGDTDDGLPFIAMEFIEGQSLDDLCTTVGPLSPQRAIHIGRQIASALAEAHGQNIVHRDLKPENILLSPKKHTPDFVKVLDFGIAKILHASEESFLTQAGAIFGTPYYLAPEQAAGGDVDHRTDLYALGVILFRMATGQLPFQSDSGMAVLVQHLKDPPPRPRDLRPDLPPALEALILRALEKTPADRWPSAEALGEALLAVGEQLAPPPAAAIIPAASSLSATISDISPEELAALPPPASRNWPATLIPGGAPARAETPSPPQPAASDPRFKVPDDRALRQPRQRAAALPLTSVPTADSTWRNRQRLAEAGSTHNLSRAVLAPRRRLFHLLVAAGSVLGGSALGAALYWQRTAGDEALVVLQPDAGRPPAPPAPGVGPVATPPPDAAMAPMAPVRASRKEVAPRPPRRDRPPRRPGRAADTRIKQHPVKVAVPPAGPDPAVEGTDHAEPPKVEAPPARVEPRPTAEPKKDDFYDMVD